MTMLAVPAWAKRSLLVRQNALLFIGGLASGSGSFIYHAIAGRLLGPVAYGQVAFLIAAYAVGATAALIISLVLARYAATLISRQDQTIRRVLIRAAFVVAAPGAGFVLIAALFAHPIATFEHLPSFTPVWLVAIAVALGWLLAVPRGILQGLQRFGSLAINVALDPVVRVAALWVLVGLGYAVSGAVAAIVIGLAAALVAGTYSLRDRFRGTESNHVPVLGGAGFPLTAAAGVVGIQLLFNQDVVLAEHYLSAHNGGIYGGLNKIGTIIFYLTLSVSQVLFPRIVDAVARQRYPARLLLSSVGILSALGVAALIVFAVAPGELVNILFGPRFSDATPYVFTVGVIGLALSLNNMLVQFLIANHDYWFIPLIAFGCVAEAGLIVISHATVGQVVADVLVAMVGLLVLLIARCYVLLVSLRHLPLRGNASVR